MGAAYFYHLTRNPLDVTLATLVEKSLGAGWRVEVRGREDQTLQRLDASLWQREGFLPHGIAGGDHDADQPVLLTTGSGGNGASCVMAIEGADVTAAEIIAAQRVCILFDGHDGDAVAHARTQWKSLTDAGCTAQYWSEDSGRWEKKADTDDKKDG
ncbi:DNA polymerase III subunit chi [Celeribacter marinus]|uniref:DNA polymerase III chi subunit n=1 Tax=Celeribacter marinus TaxID=1397108 RepID=A0A0P0A908_9RHOB|nr:DNA polymerase III subunit chi [Celeribacter marinus]ALI54265.1 DNA polymerase III chi subunit [Celeribacter marinus]SFK33512.1 DNA polymerase III, chi subunit [Celeribacter marinus]